ncbi:MAG: hypothetical protein OEZ08_00940 [Betaproteobacteria bacterium]|nr:hypothetical protein [Betaproteobacteria bacterium]
MLSRKLGEYACDLGMLDFVAVVGAVPALGRDGLLGTGKPHYGEGQAHICPLLLGRASGQVSRHLGLALGGSGAGG